MEQAINAYRSITVDEAFREKERLYSLARHNEASALRHARNQGRDEGRTEGKAEGISAMLELIHLGLTPEEAAKRLRQ